jgi:hypothetical protein
MIRLLSLMRNKLQSLVTKVVVKIKYRFTPANMIVTPPEKQLTMPDAEIKFELKFEDFDWIMRAANVLSSPQIAIESDGKKVNIVTLDLSNDSAHTDALEITEGTGKQIQDGFQNRKYYQDYVWFV